MDSEPFVSKYTRRTIAREQLVRTAAAGPLGAALANAIEQTASDLARIEDGLRATGATITRAVSRVRDAAGSPRQPQPILNPLGELQNTGLQFDLLIAQRDSAISHLRTLAELWHLHDQQIGGQSS